MPELLAIQGFPVFVEELQTPITQIMLFEMSDNDFKPSANHLIGNSMHHAGVGAPLLFCLLEMQRVVSHAVV